MPRAGTDFLDKRDTSPRQWDRETVWTGGLQTEEPGLPAFGEQIHRPSELPAANCWSDSLTHGNQVCKSDQEGAAVVLV